MNWAALHTVGLVFTPRGGIKGQRVGQRTEFFRIFLQSWTSTAITAGFVIETASTTAKFASIPVRRASAWTFRTFMRPRRMPLHRGGGSRGRDHAGLLLFIG